MTYITSNFFSFRIQRKAESQKVISFIQGSRKHNMLCINYCNHVRKFHSNLPFSNLFVLWVLLFYRAEAIIILMEKSMQYAREHE